MSEEYLRKDTFDETMKRIESMMAASEARHEAIAARQDRQIAEIRGEVKELRAVIGGYGDTLASFIEGTNNRLDDMARKNQLWQNVLGFVIGFSAVAVAAASVYLALR